MRPDRNAQMEGEEDLKLGTTANSPVSTASVVIKRVNLGF